MDDIPSLTLKKILSFVGERSFNLGQQYAADGAITHTLREGHTIKATCQGTRRTPYRVWATFTRSSIEASHCSCPVGSGSCKHVAALLIAWQQTPQAFTETLPVEDKLARLDNSQLLSLIKQLLRRDPNLEQIIDAMPLPGQPITADLFQKQADAIFATGEGEWGEAAELTDQAMAITETANDFLKSKDIVSAAAVYRGVLASLVHHYQEFPDDEGHFFESIGLCCDGLRTCIESLHDEPKRLPLFRALLDVIKLDGELGGIDLGDCAYAALMEEATAPERREIARWIADDKGFRDFVMDLLGSDVPNRPARDRSGN